MAWLTVDGTNIDYPVMQSENNTKYLNMDPFGNYSLSGSIYLDSRNSGDFTDDYSILYGHHMEYGKMFGALDDFLNEDYLRKHTSGSLIIGKDGHKTYKLRIFASLKGSARDDKLFDPAMGKGVLRHIESDADVFTEKKDDRILVMSTCNDADSVTRVLVFAYITDD